MKVTKKYITVDRNKDNAIVFYFNRTSNQLMTHEVNINIVEAMLANKKLSMIIDKHMVLSEVGK